ncbi:MAG: transcriptional repressor NrdR [Deltaproteobacteria bacterium]|nr:transcriptional repressor NrdR [Deltaproteobacteria bacterium]
MRCPRCSSEETSVIDSRADDNEIRRRRECQSCQFRFTTYERVELALPMVIKKDGRRQPFARDKIRAGLLRACEKRPVSMELIDKTVERIEQKVLERCVKEISSMDIGDLLMDALREIDKIAYIRFASVYREFSDISQFVDALESLDKRKGRGPNSRKRAVNAGD